MRFAHPEILLWWLLLPVLAAALFALILRQRSVILRLGQPETVRRLAASASLERRAIKLVLLLVGAALVVLALARPQWGRKAEPVTHRGVDVLIALDVSESMRAEDVAPNRFLRAKGLVADLVDRLPGHRIGLMAFAGSAYMQCPLTLDQSAIRLFLDIMEIGDVPDPGSDLGEAVKVALDTFPETGGQRVLILVTDGEDHGGKAAQAAEEAAGQGVVVYTIGTGTAAGGPIPLADGAGGYKKDSEGRVVTTRLEAAQLEAVAQAGGGRALTATTSLAAASRLADEIDGMMKADLSSRIITTHEDRFQWPLLAGILFFLVEGVLSAARRRPGEAA